MFVSREIIIPHILVTFVRTPRVRLTILFSNGRVLADKTCLRYGPFDVVFHFGVFFKPAKEKKSAKNNTVK